MTWHRAWIALGSNLGDREAHIHEAIHALVRNHDIEIVRESTIVETDAVAAGAQPKYLNAAAEVATTLSPRDLLERLLLIERLLGRRRSPGTRHEPRTIDLDLLLYELEIIEEPGLTLPHPRMHERRFVLDPLAEIASDLIHPVLGVSIDALRRALEESARRR